MPLRMRFSRLVHTHNNHTAHRAVIQTRTHNFRANQCATASRLTPHTVSQPHFESSQVNRQTMRDSFAGGMRPEEPGVSGLVQQCIDIGDVSRIRLDLCSTLFGLMMWLIEIRQIFDSSHTWAVTSYMTVNTHWQDVFGPYRYIDAFDVLWTSYCSSAITLDSVSQKYNKY